MQPRENTPARWESVIADLSVKASRYETEITELTTNRDALALDAELNINGASQKLQKLQADIASKQSASSTIHIAIEQAQSKLANARKVEAEAAEQERQRQLAMLLGEFVESVQRTDALLERLSEQFQASRARLDEAMALMTPAESAPFQQLRSQFAPTLAASYYGLGDFVQLGPLAGHIQHRQKFEQFVSGFVDRWIPKPDTSVNAKEATNGAQQ